MKRYFFVLLSLAVLSILILDSCNDDINNDPVTPDADPGLYLGLIGFNEDLYEKQLIMLNESSQGSFNNFIDGLSSNDGTILYHAVNKSLNNLSGANLPDDLVNVSIVTFTDGLDLGSYVLNSSYNSGEEYLAAVHDKIMNLTIKEIPVSAYSIGIKGEDVTDIELFHENLNKLASAPENAFEVSDVNELNTRFQLIASSLTSVSSSSFMNLTMPAPSPNTIIRFTFDNVQNAANSTIYIEGTFTAEDGNYSLTNITYAGLICESGSSLSGSASGIKITFSFLNLKRDDGIGINTGSIDQWSYIPANDLWQVNSEFNPDEDTQTNIEQHSAAIILVLDCSSSLGDDFLNMQEAARAFIQILVDGGGGPVIADYSQIRFEKVSNYTYVSDLGLWDENNSEIASHFFGPNAGVSNYITVEPGSHRPVYYFTEPGEVGWFDCMASPGTYPINEGYKYKLQCSDDGTSLNFSIINEGLILVSSTTYSAFE